MFQYKCGHELLDQCSQMGTSLAEISILSEAEESGLDRNSIWEKMEHLLDTMEEAIRKGLQPGVKTMGGLIGGNAFRLSGAAKGHTVCGPSVVKAPAMPWQFRRSTRLWDELSRRQPLGPVAFCPGACWR